MKIMIDGIEVSVLPQDNYLQINDIPNAELARLWPGLRAQYPHFEKWLCYHNTLPPVALLGQLGAVLEDESIELRLTPQGFTPRSAAGIRQVEGRDFAAFAAFHHACNPNMYWTAERIGRKREQWGIFAQWAGNTITGYTLISLWDPAQAEIFCVQGADAAQCADLISAALAHAIGCGKTDLLFMADADTPEHEAGVGVGFASRGFYQGYRIPPEK